MSWPKNLHGRVRIYLGLSVLLVVTFLVLRDREWAGNAELHTIMEVIAALVAAVVGGVALIRYYTKKTALFLFVGTGFLGAGMLDGYHAVTTSTIFVGPGPSEWSAVAQWSWVQSRLFLSAVLFASWIALRVERMKGSRRRFSERYLYLATALLMVASIAILATVPLPAVYKDGMFMHRPEELVPAIFLLLTLIAYLRSGGWKEGHVEHWLIMSLILGLVSEVVFMPLSQQPYDLMFARVHIFKIASYVLVLIGLLASIQRVFRQAEEGANLLDAMMRSVPGFMYVKDRQARFTRMNLAGARLFGVENPEDVRGRRDSDFVTEETAWQAESSYAEEQEQMRTGRTLRRVERRAKWPGQDGSRWYLTSKAPILDHEGDVTGIVGVGQDITDRKKAEEALRESENRLRALVEAIPDGLFRVDGDGRIVQHSPGEAFERRANMGTFAGHNLSELVPAKDAGRMMAAMRAVLSGEEVEPIEFARGDEDRRQFEARLAKSGDDEVIAIVRDISDRKRAEAALRASEIRTRSLLNAIPDGLFRADAEGTVIEFVAGKEYVPHLPPERFVGKNVAEILPRDAKARIMRGIGTALAGEHAGEIDVTFGEGEDERDYEVRFTKSGEAEVIAIVRDVTERKRAERALMEARDEAEQANRTKSDFLSNMSHELRTPLNSVLGFSQLLERDTREPLSDVQQLAVGQIEKAGRHLLKLIDEVLDLAQIESGQLSLSPEPMEIGPLLDEALSIVTPTAREREITIDYRPAGLEETWVWSDRTRLKQVLLNLLSNAVKFNRDNGSVLVSLGRVDGGRLAIGIEDSGIGISRERMPLLFEPFERLGAETMGVEGTGIGLTISKRLIEQMGGSITADSESGEGSKFTIEIPSAGGVGLAATEIVGNLPAAMEGGAELDGEKRQILYVEDNPSNLYLVQAILARRADIELLQAPDARTGIELAKAHRPDLIILDINILGMDGFEALERLRDTQETSAIPAIALSADALPRQIEKGLAAGFVKYLTKPIDVDSFMEAIDDVLNGRR